MPRSSLLLFFAFLVGCGDGSTTVSDLGTSPDQSTTTDLSRTDLAGADLAGVDLAGAPDLADVDLAQPCPTYPVGGGGGMNRPMIALPGGTIQLGNPTKYDVPVSPFSLDVFEVTVGAYRNCVAAGACTEPPTDADGYCNWSSAPSTLEQQPVNCVTHPQADAFCKWAGRRLPTMSELLWALWGTSSSRYPWGDTEPTEGTDDPLVCWQVSDGPCDVGTKPFTLFGAQSCFGFSDLSGNIGELSSTKFETPYVYPETACPLDTSTPCAAVGGSWRATGASNFRTTLRDYAMFVNGYSEAVGFRCAK